MSGELHRRRSIRLRGFDYTSGGQYFVTICTHEKDCLFGEVIQDQMFLNKEGKIVWECWMDIPKHFSNACVFEEAFVVMPNHVHGIVEIVADDAGVHCGGKADRRENMPSGCRGTACCAPTEYPAFQNIIPGSLGTIIRSFKSAVTKRINDLWSVSDQSIWQRNYFERIIRNEKELERMQDYILNNPSHWGQDEENPALIVA
jgi:REP element-mobilizing transposase RayT